MFWPHSPSTCLRNWFGVFSPNPTGRVSWALSHLAFLWCDHFLGSIAHFHLICCSSQSWDTVNSLLLPSLDRSLTQESKSYQRQKLLQLVKGFRKKSSGSWCLTVGTNNTPTTKTESAANRMERDPGSHFCPSPLVIQGKRKKVKCLWDKPLFQTSNNSPKRPDQYWYFSFLPTSPP